MTITTKLNLGDCLWMLRDDRVRKGEVREIKAVISCNFEDDIRYSTHFEGLAVIEVCESAIGKTVFTSKQELLDSL